MKVQIECGQCQTKLAVDTQHAGKKGRCPKCKAEFIIPGEEPQPAAPAASPQPPPPPESAGYEDSVGRGAVEDGPKLCPSCDELRRYALEQLARCVHGDAKPTCRRCTIHCYDTDHRERIQAVMRFAGPRLVLRNPMDVIRHIRG